MSVKGSSPRRITQILDELFAAYPTTVTAWMLRKIVTVDVKDVFKEESE